MGALQWQFTMSLDGFIAGPGGDMSWLARYLAPNPEVDEVTGTVGALLVGARTYRGDDPYKGTGQEGQPYGGGWTGPQFVLTHHAPSRPAPGVTFVGDLASGVAAAREAARDKYVAVLGAQVGRECIEAGVLDEILVFIVPVLLGDGVRMFDRPGGTPVPLEPAGRTPVMTTLRLRVA